MKIAIITFHFPPKKLGGTEIATYNIAERLSSRGFDIHIITTADKGYPKFYYEKGFKVHRLFTPKVRVLNATIFWISAFFSLCTIKPDIIQAQGIGMGVPSLLYKIIFRTPLIVWGQGNDIYLTPPSMRLITRIVLKHANLTIALTDHMKREIEHISGRKSVIIPNGIDLSTYNKSFTDDLFFKYDINNEFKKIIFVGKFRPEKGIEYLIQSMGIIINLNKKLKLFLVGNGPEEPKLRRLVQQKNLSNYVIFIGEVPNNDVPNYLVSSDIFVLPSLSEAFGIVNLEAMAAGLPIVTSDVRGLSEIITDGENGFLVPPGNPEKIAEKILLLLENEELRKQLSKNNLEKVKQYSWESVTEKLEEVYKQLIKDHN